MQKCDVSVDDYELTKKVKKMSTLIYKCAEAFNVDIVELLTGENPKLKKYSVVRKGTGLPVERRAGFMNICIFIQKQRIEPFLVTEILKRSRRKTIALSSHEGQEFDYVLSGTLKFVIGDKVKIFNAGDSII